MRTRQRWLLAARQAKPLAFTLIELLVVVAIIALLISILLPSLSTAREQAKMVKCGAHQRAIGQAVVQCQLDREGFYPTYDDGTPATKGKQVYMLTWVDVLYDLDYLGNTEVGVCPTDKRPDSIARLRGDQWGFKFAKHQMGLNAEGEPGVRSSYAINLILHMNFRKDQFSDETRQILCTDGWWSWFNSVNAAFVTYGGGATGDALTFPNSHGTMIAWRHGRQRRSQVLYRDGHVANMEPRSISTIQEARSESVDTSRYFAWLPGECTTRTVNDFYQGTYSGVTASPWTIDEYRNRLPAWVKAFTHGRGKLLGADVAVDGPPNYHPYNMDEQLSAVWRTDNNAWRKLPNDSHLRH